MQTEAARDDGNNSGVLQPSNNNASLSNGAGVFDRAWLNLARGIGIMAVVFGHINPGFGPSVGTFHMPLFFFLGGVAMLPERPLAKVAQFVSRDLLQFAVLMSAAYALVGAFLDSQLGTGFNSRPIWDLPLFTTDILVQTAHSAPFALTAWFLVAYAGAILVCQWLLKRAGRYIVTVSLVLGLILYVAGVKFLAPHYTHRPDTWYWNVLAQITVGSGFMLLGVAFARFRWPKGLLTSPATLLLVLMGYRAVIWQYRPLDIGMVFSQYPAGVLVGGAAALLGTVGTILLANRLRSRWFEWLGAVGAASKHVMAHHLFFFTVLNLAFVALGWMSIADVQNVYSKLHVRATWPLYLLMGVGGSMLVYFAIEAVTGTDGYFTRVGTWLKTSF
jgi:fucose 4-O-acetylase-like acetyltransferase